MGGFVYILAYMWKEKDSLEESDVSFYHVWPTDSNSGCQA